MWRSTHWVRRPGGGEGACYTLYISAAIKASVVPHNIRPKIDINIYAQSLSRIKSQIKVLEFYSFIILYIILRKMTKLAILVVKNVYNSKKMNSRQ